jgi:hypothetical protein
VSSEEREFEKMVREFDTDDLKDFMSDEEKELVKTQQKMRDQKRALVETYVAKVSELFFRAHAIASSNMAVQSFMDENKRKMVVYAMKNRVLNGIATFEVGLMMNEKFCQDDRMMAELLNNLRLVNQRLIKFTKDYIDKLEKGWGGGGAKAMLADVKKTYESELGLLEGTVLHHLPHVAKDTQKFRRYTENKMADSARLASV